MLIKGFIFDLDGVIVDTAKYHFEAWCNLAHSLGGSLSEEENEQLKGVSRLESLLLILELNNITLPESEIQRLLQQKNQDYLSLIDAMSEEELLPGVSHFIESAKKVNLKIGLGSASKNARSILDKTGITHFFEAIVDGNSVEKSKPDPEVFILGAQILNLAPHEIIVFEDSVKGLLAAKKGGFHTVGIGSQSLDYADVMIEDFSQFTVKQVLDLF